MTEQDARLIEPPTRLSSSKLWQIQRNYFRSMGVEAWHKEVPFYISSNMALAKRYATLICNYLQDLLNHFPAMRDEIFYILELGSGTGRFSYYFLTAFKKLLPGFGLEHIKFCYILTDVTEKNITFCRENPMFSGFLERGELDFAHFNVENSKDFTLSLKNKKYAELQSKPPLIIIANYIFDCIQQDMFSYEKGKFQEIRLGLSSRYKNFDIEKSLHLNELRFQYFNEDIDIEDYYDSPVLSHLLKNYQKTFGEKKATIIIPVGALQFIDNIIALTNGKFFMIAGDKGISTTEQMHHLDENYRSTYDGCYSFLVNFHAMGEYIKRKGGDRLLTQYRNDFNVNLFEMGLPFSQLGQTVNAYKNYVDCVSADEYCYIFDEYLTSNYRFAFKGLLSFLRFSEWDPTAYAAIHDRLYELIPGATLNQIEDLKRDLVKVEENNYPLKYAQDVYLLLGMSYLQLALEDKALALYLKSMEIFKEKSRAYNYAAGIYEKKRDTPKALACYQKALEGDKNNVFAKRKVMQLTGRPYLAALGPLFKSILVISALVAALYFISR